MLYNYKKINVYCTEENYRFMKIEKNKQYKFILLFVGVVIVAGTAVAINMKIKYDNKPYRQAEKIIEKVCDTKGLPLLFADEVVEYKEYISNKEKINSYEWLYKLSDITFSDSTGMYNMVDSDSIGDFIKYVEIEENGKKEIYEVYEVKNISNEYIVAVKVPEDGKYIGVTSMAYKPDDLEDLINDLQLENSYVDIEFYDESQTVLYQDIDIQYICNNYLSGNKKYIFRSVSYQRYHGLERESLNLRIKFYHKSMDQLFNLYVYDDGNIRFFLENCIDYEFEADMEDTLALLNYILENYTGCIYIKQVM